MKVKNIDLINFLKGFFNLGSLREYLTDPENNKLMRHEISQYKDNIRHGCCEVYFPTDGENRKLENFFQLKNGKKHGITESYHKNTGTIETRFSYVNDTLHGWRDVYNEGGEMIQRQLYEDGKLIKTSNF